ncbi:hypothetical protein BAE44_0003378, partial [Dichanthelium oligosanthes]
MEPRPFTLMHFWNILKEEPKDSNTVQQDGSADQAGGSMGKRPLGRDAAKKKKKANSSSSGRSVEYANKFHDLSLKKLSYLKDLDDDRRNKMARLVEIEEEKCCTMRLHQEHQLALEERKLRLQEEETEIRRREAEEERERQRRAEEEEMERWRRADEERILGVDLDACPPALRQYYQELQSQILDR